MTCLVRRVAAPSKFGSIANLGAFVQNSRFFAIASLDNDSASTRGNLPFDPQSKRGFALGPKDSGGCTAECVTFHGGLCE